MITSDITITGAGVDQTFIDGDAQVTIGSFITIAEGTAGLRFTPSADFNGTANFNLQSSIGSAGVVTVHHGHGRCSL